MKRTILSAMLINAACWCAGQCTMTTELFADVSCQGAQVNVATSGGTSPFTILVETMILGFTSTQFVQQVTNDADGDLFGFYSTFNLTWDAMNAVRVTVVDAANCTVKDTVPFQPFNWRSYTALPPQLDCATGAFKATMNFSFWGPPMTFRVDNGPVQNVAGNWTSTGGGHVLNAILTPGSHSITFPQYTQGVIICESSTTVQIPAPISPGDCAANFRLLAALDGALPSGTLMTDGLRAAGQVPLSEPYSALGYSYVGSTPGASLAPALLAVTGDNAIVDWVVVEVRSTASPFGVLFSKPALLQRDGDVIDIDGDGYLSTNLAPGSYRVALRHRNHLGVMTAAPRSLTMNPATTTVDFRNAATTTHGTDARVLKGSVYCLWGGDANGDGQVKYTGSSNDRDPILIAVGSTTPNSPVPNVYDRRDTNLDGVIKYTGTGNDRDIILNNVGSTTPNNTRTQQLP